MKMRSAFWERMADSVIDGPCRCDCDRTASGGADANLFSGVLTNLRFELVIKKTISTESNSCNQQAESYTSAASKFQPLRLPQ